MRQGVIVKASEIEKIKRLLRETEILMPDIARRFNVSKSYVSGINVEFHIREYVSQNQWRVGERLVTAA